MRKTTLFLVGAGFLVSCGGEQKTDSNSTSDTSASNQIDNQANNQEDLDLLSDDAERLLISDATNTLSGGVPATITAEYYSNHWNGSQVGSAPYTPETDRVYKEADDGDILQYLSVDDGDTSVSWAVKDVDNGSGTFPISTLFQINGTSGNHDELVMINGQSLSYGSAPYRFCGDSGGTDYYCDDKSCKLGTGNGDDDCYDASTGAAYSGSSVNLTDADDNIRFYFAKIEATSNSTTISTVQWLEIIDEKEPIISGLDNYSVRYDPNSNTFVTLDNGADADGSSNVSFNYSDTYSDSTYLLARIYNCSSSEDSIDLDGSSEINWHFNTSDVDVENGSVNTLAEYSTSNGTEFIDFDGDGTKENTAYCDRFLWFDASGDDGRLDEVIQELTFKNSAGASAVEGDRKIEIRTMYGNGSTTYYGGVSQVATVTVQVWADPVLSEVAAITTPTNDPKFTISSTKAGNLALSNNGGNCTNISISPSSIAASTNTEITLSHDTSWTDQAYTGCEITITETESGLSLTDTYAVGAFTYSSPETTLVVKANADSVTLTSGDSTRYTDIVLSGTTELGATIDVDLDDDGGAADHSTTADPGDGTWSVSFTATEKTYNIAVTVTDGAATGTQTGADPFIFTVDTSVSTTLTVVDDVSVTNNNLADTSTTNDTALTFSGTATNTDTSADVGASVTITATYDDGGGGGPVADTLGSDTDTTDASGDWSITPTGMDETGDYAVTVTVVDAVGNQTTETFNFTLDITGPPDPTISLVDDDEAGTDTTFTGGLTDGAYTDDTNLLVEVDTDADYGSVTIEFSPSVTCNATEDVGNSVWSCTSGNLSDGQAYTITATAYDAAGNAASSTDTFTVNIDTSAPSAPSNLVFADDVGSVTTNLTTNGSTDDTNISVSGEGEIGQTATLFVDGSSVGTTTITDNGSGTGVWTIATGALTDMETYTITATVTDQAGNISAASSDFVITIDTQTATTLVVTDDVDEYQGTLPLNALELTNDHTFTLSGVVTNFDGGSTTTFDENATVTITATLDTGSGASAKTLFAGSNQTTTDASGAWSITVDTLGTTGSDDGEYVITAAVTDAAGNDNSAALTTYTFDLDTQAPDENAVTLVVTDDVGSVQPGGGLTTGDRTDDTELLFSGTGWAANATLTFSGLETAALDVGGDVLSGTTVLTDGSGDWSAPIDAANPMVDGVEYNISVTMTDEAGNTSGSVDFDVTIDTQTATTLVVTDDVDQYQGNLPLNTLELTNDHTFTLSGVVSNTLNPSDTFDENATVTITATLDTGSGASAKTLFAGGNTATTDASGAWSITVDNLLNDGTDDGEYVITAAVLDVAGNDNSAALTTYTFDLDTTPPPDTTISLVDDDEAGTDTTFTGGLSDGDYTDDTNLLVEVDFSTGETYDRVTIEFSPSVTCNATEDIGNSVWSCTSGNLSDGQAYTITATGYDAAGNPVDTPDTFTINIDTTAPNAPDNLVFADDVGAVTTNLTTNGFTDDTDISVSGEGEIGQTATLFVDGSSVGTTTITDNGSGTGVWTIATGALTDMETYTITATVTDQAGNISAASSDFVITIDTQTATTLVVTDDVDEYQGTLPLNALELTNDHTFTLSGVVTNFDGGSTTTFDENATVTITATLDTGSGASAKTLFAGGNTATTDASGAWSITVDNLLNDGTDDGEYVITAAVTDVAGNDNSAALTTYTFDLDTQAPDENAVTLVVTDDVGSVQPGGGLTTGDRTDDTELLFSGTGWEANATLTFTGLSTAALSGGDAQSGTTVLTDGSGDWTAPIDAANPLVDGETYNISVAIMDLAGNTSNSVDFEVIIDTQTATTLVVADDVDEHQGNLPLNTHELTNDHTFTLSGVVSNNLAPDTFDENATVTITATLDGVSKDLFSPSNANTATTDASGAWDITINGLNNDGSDDGEYVVTASVTDVAGNTNSTDYTFDLDTTPPADPVISLVDDDEAGTDTTFTGGLSDGDYTDDTNLLVEVDFSSGETYDNVTIEFSPSVTCNATEDIGNSVWSCTSGNLSDGQAYTITATAYDLAGNVVDTPDTFIINIDTTAPAVPDNIVFSDDVGTLQDPLTTNGFTDDTDISVSGEGEIGQTLTLFVRDSDNNLIYSPTTTITDNGSGTGVWTIATGVLTDMETYTITATVTDQAGNISAASTGFVITIDTQTATTLVVADAVDNHTGNLTDGDITNDHGLVLSGVVTNFDGGSTTTFDENATVTITATLNGGGKSLFTGSNQVTTDASGAWTITIDGLNTTGADDGDYVITASVSDVSENTNSTDFNLTLDTQAPTGLTLVVTDDVDDVNGAGQNNSFTGDLVAGVEGFTDDDILTLSGLAEADSLIWVDWDGDSNPDVNTTTDGLGSWSVSSGHLVDGTYDFSVTSEDAAGNTSTAVSYEVIVDTVAPNAPVITAIADPADGDIDTVTGHDMNAATLEIQGTAENFSTLEISGHTIVTANITSDTSSTPNWTGTTDAVTEGVTYTFTAVATDRAGNRSLVSTAFDMTIDLTATPPTFSMKETDASGSDLYSSDGVTGTIAGGVVTHASSGIMGTTATELYLSGTAEADSTFPTVIDVITDSSTNIASVQEDGAGAWTATTSSLADGQYIVEVMTTDDAENEATATAFDIIIDTTGPNLPGLGSPLNIDEMSLSGTIVGSVSATDAGIEGIVYTESGGTGLTYFSIDPDSGEVTFDPDGAEELDHETDDTLTYKVTATDALGNTEAQSTRTFTILINDLNDSPVVDLDNGSPQNYEFTSIDENDSKSAELRVTDIINGMDTPPVDPDGDSQGIAIYNVVSTGPGAGSWYYNEDNSGWVVLPDVTVNALLLDNNDKLRFEPDGDNGETSTLTFYVLDIHSGNLPSSISSLDVQDFNNRGGENRFSINEMEASIVVTDVNDDPVFSSTLPDGSYTEDTPTIDLSGTVINDVDFGEALTMTITLGTISWPDDQNAPDGSGFDFDQDGDATNDSVRQTYPGTLATDNFAWDSANNELVITGSVADVNAELATLVMTPILNLDFDFSISMNIADDDNADNTDPIDYTCSSRSDDPPIAMIYTGVYESVGDAQGGDLNNATELSGANLADAWIRLDGRESWDPDLSDAVVNYTFIPSRAVNTIELRDGEGASSGSFAGIAPGLGYTTTEPVIVYKADLVDFVSWRLVVTDADGTPNSPGADQYDEAGVEAANTAPYAAIFPAGTECSRAHAEADQHPTYIDEEAACFCDSSDGSGTCLDAEGQVCTPVTFTSGPASGALLEIPAVFASESASGDGCYCDRPVCDGTDGAPICYNATGASCTPATTYCTPVPTPNDYSFPFDHNIDMTVCAYDVDVGDVLSYSWTIQNIVGQSQQELELIDGDTLQQVTAPDPVEAQNARVKVLSTGPSGFNGFADFNLVAEVSDGEDTTTIIMNTDICIGRYEDDDNDAYVNEQSFYANCVNTSDFDIALDPTISYLQQDDPAKLGWDCLDDSTAVIVDTDYGAEASITTLTAAEIQDTINWYIDSDGDGYGSYGSSLDDSDGNNILDTSEQDGDSATDIEVAYGGENIVGNCVVDKPSSNGYDYVLNNDDCNDTQPIEFTYTNLDAGTQVTRALTPDFQTPETVWNLDADADGFASNYVWDSAEGDIDYDLLYFSEDYTCLCDAGCGNCAKPRVQTNSTTSAEACSTTPAACITYKAVYNSCEEPSVVGTVDGDTIDPNSTWIIGQRGDCNESNLTHNPTAQEQCDPNNEDEDCNGLADDDDTNVNGAFAYYNDGDADGYPNENQKVESCDGGSASGYNFVQAYDLTNAVETDANGNVLLSDSQDPTSTTAINDCVCATDSCDQACISLSSTDSSITYCAANPDQSVVSTCVIGDPYDPQDPQFDSFQIYVFDCDDTRPGVYPSQTEFCDGVLNDCITGGGIPTDEVDYDNDSYVECDYQGGWLGGASTEPNIGSDCSPQDPNVYPNAPSICDGQYNNCASWVEKYVDEDGDCYCSGQNGDGSCEDSYCVDDTGEVCVPTDDDGDAVAACAVVDGAWMSPGAPTNQVDNDGDCYVECYDGSTTWMGDLAVLGGDCLNLLEGQDCNDATSQVYPGAPEVCDGQYNDCTAASYDPSSAPSNETDDDLDSYVDCAQGEYLDRNGCVCFDSDGSGAIDGDELNECEAIGGACVPDQPTLALVTWVSQPGPGYSDCDDLDATRYPGANEICDGQFNDCYHELLDPFEGVAGDDCFCADQNGTSCVNSAGDVCTPDGDLVQLSTPETISSSDYDYQEVECYCTNSFCEIDIDGDLLSDCLDENSDPCYPTDDDFDGFADNCVADPLSVDDGQPVSRLEYLFNDVTNSYPEAPGRELDNDGDTYIECNIGGNTWLGSPNVVAGGDCDDYQFLVKPAGTEYCDGQYNDCDALTYDEFGAPTDETDDDLDGYVECELTPGVPWERTDTEPTGYGDCNDADNVIYPGAPELCDGVYNNCSDGAYDAASAPANELDGDADGYVECSNVGDVWKGAAITGYDDCDPSNVATYPGATDICDAQFNDCEHPMREDSPNAGAYAGVVGDCFCAITQNGSGDDVCDANDCVDATGATCTPEDADSDGYVDNCEIADAGSSASDFTPAGSTYYGVDVDCYCPTTTCQSNVSGNSSSECYTPDGATCDMPFNSSGIFTDCATNTVDTDLTVSHIFYDENGDQQSQPFEEFDNDGDRYVECTQFDLDAYQQAGGSLLVIGGSDCDDSDGRVYPAAPEYCDGQYNDCEALTYDPALAPADETDDDLDGYVECELTIGVDWDNPDTLPTGHGDCDDADNVVYPTAPELCDGIYNDCSNGSYDAASAPANELDGDGDGYVECSDVGDVWKGAAITGYDDCDPVTAVTYPGAAEICDARFNDCEHPMRDDGANGGAYAGVVGDCFCAITQNGSGDDVCDANDCVDATGATCTPEDEDQDGFVDNCEIADNASPDFNGGNTYYGAEVDCYCPETTCLSNVSGNSNSECYTPDGQTCEMPFNSTGIFTDCATNTGVADLTVSHIFYDSNGDQQTQPFEEFDNDGDRYVDCTEFDLDTYQQAGGSLLVLGGSDCNDADSVVYPAAPEYCDGQYNDCDALTYDANGAPLDETDDDGDGYVECELTNGVDWARENTLPTGHGDCDDADNVVYPTAPELCDGIYNDCSNGSYDAASAPTDELDVDLDGYVECSDAGDVWKGAAITGYDDCDPVAGVTYPGAAEICDAVFNDCEHPMRDDTPNAGAYEGVVGDCFCAITQNGSGDDVCDANDCVDWDGNTCTPEDEDQDGYVDNCEIADTNASTDFPDTGNVYYGVEVDCYCPTTDCQTSVSGNSNTECYTPDGAVCEMPFDAQGLYEDCTTEISDPALTVSHIFMDENGDQQDQPFEEYDNDGDNYVECTQFDIDVYRNSGGSLLVVGGSDCDDADVRVHPTADELCDGQYNDCDDLNYADVGAPGDETDDDGDGFIECEWDSANVPWLGSVEPQTGTDCDDTDSTVYPNALELCDGQHNNCNALTYLTTTAPDNEIDDDGDFYVECGYLGLNVWAGETVPEFGYDCDDDSATRYPGADEICDGLYNDCDSLNLGWLVNPSVLLTPPADEEDNDGDGFIECDYGSVSWEGVAGNIQGGLDCDDADSAVYPAATEVCDGQINDCENAYTDTGVPLDELDDDGDGWVECNRDPNVVWNSAIGAAEPNQVLADADPLTTTDPCFCNYVQGVFTCAKDDGTDCFLTPSDVQGYTYYDVSDCDDADAMVKPFIAMNEFDQNGDGVGVSSCLQDSDGDGYGATTAINPDVPFGHDCDDLNLLIHPEQDEFCEAGDQVDTDCNGDVNTANSPFQLDASNATLLYVDNDGDGFGDIETEATPACVVEVGFVFNQTDCNDSDPAINPIQPEICDGQDQDCDSQIDEVDSLDDPSLSRCTNMYRDVDGDGYGDAEVEVCLCDNIDDDNPAGIEEYDGDSYVIYSGDCYDFNDDIHPLSCADNIDNDEDGIVDSDDPDCIAGYEEIPADGSGPRETEEDFELLDGHDNNCDGMIAAIELDCDDDGSFPLVPKEGFGFDRAETFTMAYDVGLEVCDGLNLEISCWGETQRVVCDKLTSEIIDGEMSYEGTGLWMLAVNESEDGYGGRYDSGHREYPNGAICGSAEGDCDDQCADRCPGQTEQCDGIDNDCGDTLPGTDGGQDDTLLGIPDAMVADVLISGDVTENEIDIDGDGYLACVDFSPTDDQYQFSAKSCGQELTASIDDNDCNNFCSLTNPNAEEHCDGFLGVCGGENLDGTDADGDDGLTCGTWSGTDMTTEDIFVVVWLKEVDWAAQGSEPQEMYRPNIPDAPEVDIPDQPADTAEDSGFEGDTGDTGYSVQQSDREHRTQRRQEYFRMHRPAMDAGGGLIDGDIEAELLEDMIPLVAPRDLAPHCDSYLETQLTLLLGNERMEQIREANSREEASRIMLEACDSDFAAGCGVVRLVLSETIDDDTYTYLDEQIGQPVSFSEECLDRPEEWISRTMWQRERILEARTTTVEWECRRMFGRDCSGSTGIRDTDQLMGDWETSMISAERWLGVDRVWYKEIGRYYPDPIDEGTLMSCWGDPTSDTVTLKKDVGGDCNDESNEAHRDQPEGPGDLVGLYLYGDLEDCSTCLDGIDNNCDGAIDCADPTCAPCFVGQGVGCGGGKESPCSQGGCSTPDQSSQERMYRSFGLIMMALIISLLRRREND